VADTAAAPAGRPYTITMDTGGTFSDLVLADEHDVLGLYKAPTTPDDVLVGVLDAVGLAAAGQGLSTEGLLAATGTFIYSTTRSTNAILVGDTARTAFLATEGHRDILLYREGGKEGPLDIAVPYPEPYVPRSLTFEVRERVLADGTVAVALDEAHLEGVIDRLAELQVEAVGVCLLWSVVDPSHELAVGRRLAERLPDVEVTLSHQLNPIIREYRRASATVIDASIKPLMRVHLGQIDQRLRQLGFAGEPLMVTHLSGGVLAMADMCEAPLHSVDSGPALAPVAGLAYAAEADADLLAAGAGLGASGGDVDLVVVDAGGTSFDISPTRDRGVIYSREKWLGPIWTGHMTGLPAVDTRSVGAGGGSIASVDAGGLLTVGPASAGASPGPACYDRGGVRATVTDAAVTLGFIDPDFFLGGRMRLDADLARAAVQRDVADRLGLGLLAAAEAVLTVYDENIRAFLSEILVVNGLDPRRTLLVAGGGAAGLNIATVARELEVPRVLVPTMAAGLSAVGGQYSDVVSSFSRGWRTTTDEFDREGANATLAALSGEIDAFLARAGAGEHGSREFFCEARYAHQMWELDVSLGDRRSFEGPEGVVDLHQRFDRLHEAVFAVDHPEAPVEVITWRGEARVARPRPRLPRREAPAAAAAGTGRPGRRAAFFDGKEVEATVHDGAALAVGDRVAGPAVIEETTTTIVVPPGCTALASPTAYLIEVQP
jgi:N-methylhydantoinase A